jgi:hypothetical protein
MITKILLSSPLDATTTTYLNEKGNFCYLMLVLLLPTVNKELVHLINSAVAHTKLKEQQIHGLKWLDAKQEINSYL